MRCKVMKLEHNSNWFYKLGFPNRLHRIVMLISWIAWIRFLCMIRVKVEGDFLVIKGQLIQSKYSIFALACLISHITH